MCVYVITHACGHLWITVGTRVGMSVSLERSGRCMRLGVTAVTKELQWAEQQLRGVSGGSQGSAPGGGELRAEDGSVPSSRHVAVPVAPEPEPPLEVPVGSARWGPADARNLQSTCLPICPPTRQSCAGSCEPKGPGKTCPGVWVPSGPCLQLPALGRGYGHGVLRCCSPGKNPRPPHPSRPSRGA